jgi:uncharacterized protein YvpB
LFDYFATQSDQKSVAKAQVLSKKWPKSHIFEVAGIVLIIPIATLFFMRTSMAISPVYSRADQSIGQPFTIYLNGMVSDISLSDIKISPAISGSWEFKSGMLIGSDKLIFTPTDDFKVDTSYTVSLPSVKRVLIGSSEINDVSFNTEKAPDLASVGINAVEDNSVIAADYEFDVSFAAPIRGLRKLELRTNPDLSMGMNSTDDQSFNWKSGDVLPQGQTLAIELYDSKNDVVLATKSLKVADEPAIVTPVISDHFVDGDVATIIFNRPIDPSSSNIVFSIDGQGYWQDDTTYVFNPNSVYPGETYSYTIKAGLRSKEGGVLLADQTLTFSTTGSVKIINSLPYGNGLSQASQQIRFTFDQPVDHDSVANRFSISSGRITGTSWQGDTFIANVVDLGFQKTVVARLSSGIKNAGFGSPSVQQFSNTFTTEAVSVRLNIPFYYQQYNATCAAASLRMVLAYKGIYTDDLSIVNKMGYAPTTINKTTDPATWDDPQEMFVGSVSGSITAGTSAGPDAPPVAKAAQSFGVSATAVTGVGINWIAQQLYNGYPVIYFGATSNTSNISWKTPSGRIELMNLTSHSGVVTGVSGEPGDPLGFWISDPTGGTSYWSASRFAANINRDAYHQAVVVY